MTRDSRLPPPHNDLQLNLPDRRVKSGVTLQEIADNTKISTRFLRAIEAEDFDQLPGGVFTVSYIRQYAQAIGCDPDEVLACYRSRSKAGVEAPVGANGHNGARLAAPMPLRWLRASRLLGL